METILIGLLIAGLLLMIAGIFFGRKRRVVAAESFAVHSDGTAEAVEPDETVAVAPRGEATDERAGRQP